DLAPTRCRPTLCPPALPLRSPAIFILLPSSFRLHLHAPPLPLSTRSSTRPTVRRTCAAGSKEWYFAANAPCLGTTRRRSSPNRAGSLRFARRQVAKLRGEVPVDEENIH